MWPIFLNVQICVLEKGQEEMSDNQHEEGQIDTDSYINSDEEGSITKKLFHCYSKFIIHIYTVESS